MCWKTFWIKKDIWSTTCLLGVFVDLESLSFQVLEPSVELLLPVGRQWWVLVLPCPTCCAGRVCSAGSSGAEAKLSLHQVRADPASPKPLVPALPGQTYLVLGSVCTCSAPSPLWWEQVCGECQQNRNASVLSCLHLLGCPTTFHCTSLGSFLN